MTIKINLPLLLYAKSVRQYHSVILLSGPLDGESDTRTIEAVLVRVENQFHYGPIQDDVIAVAAANTVAILRRHWIADGNKRTVLPSILMFLSHHGYFSR